MVRITGKIPDNSTTDGTDIPMSHKKSGLDNGDNSDYDDNNNNKHNNNTGNSNNNSDNDDHDTVITCNRSCPLAFFPSSHSFELPHHARRCPRTTTYLRRITVTDTDKG